MAAAAGAGVDGGDAGAWLGRRLRPGTVSMAHSICNRRRCRSTIHRPGFCIGSVNQSPPFPLTSATEGHTNVSKTRTQNGYRVRTENVRNVGVLTCDFRANLMALRFSLR